MIESRTGNMLLGLRDLLTYIGTGRDIHRMSIVEIGTYKGDSALLFARAFGTVYCVDAWEDSTFNVPGTTAAQAEAAFDAGVGGLPNVFKVKGSSLSVAPDFTTRVDVVYIDASHDYDSVIADIKAWRDKADRFVAGHDYWPGRFPGVIKAVNEVFGVPTKIFRDTSWLVRL
jgi:hypothetical protein